MRRTFAFLTLIALPACVATSVPNTERYIVHIRPIIGWRDGWSSNRLLDQITQANESFRDTSLRFVVEPPRHHPQYETISDSNYYSARRLCDQHAANGELAVLFVRNSVKGSRSIAACAYAHMPPLNLVVIGDCVNSRTLGHEIGHVFGLSHTWEDNLDDTKSVSHPGCEDPCNLMGACTNDCSKIVLTPDQICMVNATAIGQRSYLLEIDANEQ